MTITSKGYTGTIMAGADLATWATLQGRSYLARAFSDWRVSAVSGGSGRIVQVAPGVIAGVGVEDGLDVATNASTLATLATDGTRYDMIVARRTWQTTNATSIAVIQGTSTRALPSRNTTPGTIDDQPLALVKLVRSGGTYSIPEVVDLRLLSWEPGVYIVPSGGNWSLTQALADRPGIRVWDPNTGNTYERLYNGSGGRVWVPRPLDRLNNLITQADTLNYARLSSADGGYGKGTQLTVLSKPDGTLPASGDVLYLQPSTGSTTGPSLFGIDKSGNITHATLPHAQLGTADTDTSFGTSNTNKNFTSGTSNTGYDSFAWRQAEKVFLRLVLRCSATTASPTTGNISDMLAFTITTAKYRPRFLMRGVPFFYRTPSGTGYSGSLIIGTDGNITITNLSPSASFGGQANAAAGWTFWLNTEYPGNPS